MSDQLKQPDQPIDQSTDQSTDPNALGRASQQPIPLRSAVINPSTNERTETFTIPAKPSEQDVMTLMRAFGRFLSLAAAASIQSGVITADNPACTAMMNSAGTLIATANQWSQFLMQQQQAMQGGAGPQGMPGMPGMPFRAN